MLQECIKNYDHTNYHSSHEKNSKHHSLDIHLRLQTHNILHHSQHNKNHHA